MSLPEQRSTAEVGIEEKDVEEGGVSGKGT
jgi:hypothetical protein